jgi:hypothetical protein
MKKARSLKQVNEAIQEKHPLVILVKGEGYFYITSDDEEMGLKIAGMHQSGIYVYSIQQLTVAQWVDVVGYLLKQADE